MKTMGGKAEEIRIRHSYRNLILLKKVNLSQEAARRLIGPDCAYHLYALTDRKKRGTRTG